ncbi:MAG: DUF1275 domain-containing protein [Thaumarchaeota archaeon]|nr:DUF1275 domain-containing protein [Nitrososphaerota archaeon]
MPGFFNDVRDTLVPIRGSRDGPLPPMLVGMTMVTGLVDAFSYLTLGHVFVANMTGNVLFIAFALAGVHGFSVVSSLLGLGTFFLGSFISGRLCSRLKDRGRMVSTSAGIHALLLCLTISLTILSGSALSQAATYALIITLATSMGLMNGVARKLAVPDLTTTVLTQTIAGLGADSRFSGGTGARAGRRLTSIAAMFLGALISALLILHVSMVYPLVVALAIMGTVAIAARLLSRTPSAWTPP